MEEASEKVGCFRSISLQMLLVLFFFCSFECAFVAGLKGVGKNGLFVVGLYSLCIYLRYQ